MSAVLRPGRRSDAAEIACLADMAGHGLARWFWINAVNRGEGYSPFEVGRKRARREDGEFSYRKAVVAEVDGEVAGLMLGYPEPGHTQSLTVDELPAPIVPLVALEAQVPESWYVNMLAVHAEHRGTGVGKQLLGAADEIARRSGKTQVSLIVEDDNGPAIALYERCGFAARAHCDFVPFAGSLKQDGSYVLMVRRI